MILTYKFLKSIYKDINRSVFDNKLPQHNIFIRTEYKGDDFDTCYAWYEVDAGSDKPNGIVFNQWDWCEYEELKSNITMLADEQDKRLAEMESDPEHKYEDAQVLIATMIHEMIHAWTHFIGCTEVAHGETFMTWAKHGAEKYGMTVEDIIDAEQIGRD